MRRQKIRREGSATGLGALAAVAILGASISGVDFALSSRAAVAREALPINSTPPVRKSARTFDIVASGDLLIHGPVWQAAARPRGGYDFRPLFANVKPIVRRAALALCHVETPMGAGTPSGYPIFNSPGELAPAIAWTGWDACSTASNHSVDKGQYGVGTTIRALRQAGVRHAGTARTAEESRRTLILRVRGLRIAFLSYSYGTNGIPLPNPWSVNLISTRRIVADARRARRRGADFVVTNLHWGYEYVHEPNQQQRDLANYLLRRGVVDVIVGQHAHVVQSISRVGRRFVVYGEGNLISAQTTACCPGESQDGLIAVIHVRAVGTRAKVTGVDYVPTYVEHPSFVVQPVGARLSELERSGQGASALANALRISYRRTVGYAGRTPFIRPLPRRLE
jgi:poly-gamma-glutamate capsule biosynthesis protein CapA/YwtB (metallophosphatase superfamily)